MKKAKRKTKATKGKAAETGQVHELGAGILGWPRDERVTDRYGAVNLCTGGGMAKLDASYADKRGRLVAIVTESRVSSHVGDFFRGLGPGVPPKVGERIVLNEQPGSLFFDECGNVGVEPDDGRRHDWLNPKALYRAHDQTVRLVFEEAP